MDGKTPPPDFPFSLANGQVRLLLGHSAFALGMALLPHPESSRSRPPHGTTGSTSTAIDKEI
jgi:hypothetical protein